MYISFVDFEQLKFVKPSGCPLPSADAASTSTIVHIPWFCWARSKGLKLSGALYHSKTNKALDLFDVTIPKMAIHEQFLTGLGFAR